MDNNYFWASRRYFHCYVELNTHEEKVCHCWKHCHDYAFVRLIIAMPLYAVQYRTMLSRSGRDRNFIDPSIPQENRLCSGPMATCVTPEVEPMFLKNVLLLCSPGKLTTNWWTSNPHTCKMIKEQIIIKTLYHQPCHNPILTTSFIFFKITKKNRNSFFFSFGWKKFYFLSILSQKLTCFIVRK